MRFCPKTHQHYGGIDLHAKTMYLCLLDREGRILLQKNLWSRPAAFLGAVARSATISSLPSSASSPGTGSPICALNGRAREPTSSWDTGT